MRKYLQCNVDTRYLNRKGSEKLCETPMWVHFGSFVNRLYFVTFSGSKSPICTNHTFFHSFQTCNLIGRSNTDSFDGARRWQDGNWNFVQKKKSGVPPKDVRLCRKMFVWSVRAVPFSFDANTHLLNMRDTVVRRVGKQRVPVNRTTTL